MFIYQKDGTLDIMFQKTQTPAPDENKVDICLKKDGSTVQILVNGTPIGGGGRPTEPFSVSPLSANIVAGGESVVLTVSGAVGTLKCVKKADGSTATGLSRVISDNTITVTASASAAEGAWIYTVSDDNSSIEVTFNVTV